MNCKAYQVAFPVALVVLMVAFLSGIFFVNASPSFAASAKKKSSAAARTTAVEHTESQIKQLQGSLNITEAQQALWNNLTQVMRGNAIEMDALTKDRAETKTENAVERIQFYTQLTETQLNHLKKLLPPFEAFYASMSDEQKKIIDTTFRTGKHGKHKSK